MFSIAILFISWQIVLSHHSSWQFSLHRATGSQPHKKGRSKARPAGGRVTSLGQGVDPVGCTRKESSLQDGRKRADSDMVSKPAQTLLEHDTLSTYMNHIDPLSAQYLWSSLPWYCRKKVPLNGPTVATAEEKLRQSYHLHLRDDVSDCSVCVDLIHKRKSGYTHLH